MKLDGDAAEIAHHERIVRSDIGARIPCIRKVSGTEFVGNLRQIHAAVEAPPGGHHGKFRRGGAIDLQYAHLDGHEVIHDHAAARDRKIGTGARDHARFAGHGQRCAPAALDLHLLAVIAGKKELEHRSIRSALPHGHLHGTGIGLETGTQVACAAPARRSTAHAASVPRAMTRRSFGPSMDVPPAG